MFWGENGLHHVLQRDHISRRFYRFSAQKLRRDLFARHRSGGRPSVTDR